jgi:hypothetical protein
VKLLENHGVAWLWNTAEEEVYMHCGKCSQLIFHKLKGMFLSSWKTDGEQWLVDSFHDLYYLDNNVFNKWSYNASGLYGHIPQNNSHKRRDLNTSRGCASLAGIIKKSCRNRTSMMNNELPCLIFVDLIERTEVRRNFPHQ